MARSLRQRGLDVHVVGPESIPFQRVLGIQLGTFIRDIHASHGVVFHLGTSVARIDGSRVTLNDASTIEADFVVLGSACARPSCWPWPAFLATYRAFKPSAI
jgi:apoptosis-inducing factor 3